MPYKDKEKQREYQRQWMARRREEWLEANGPCQFCGSGEDLEVDHIDPEHKVSHRVWSWSKERREAELANCRVLCSDCHKERTAEYRRDQVQHGTATMYDLACRCVDCREFKRQKNARFRQ